MRSVPTLLVLIGLALSLLPPATCLGFGRSCCCCVPGSGNENAAGTPAEAPTVANACPCQGPEVRRCGEESAPRTQPQERLELVPIDLPVALSVSAPGSEPAIVDAPSASPHRALAIPLHTLHCILLI